MLVSVNTVLIHLIRIALFFFIILVLAIPITTIFLNWRKNYIDNHRKTLYREYETEIFSYLCCVNNNNQRLILLKDKLNKINKAYFIDILSELSRYIKFGEQVKIKQLAATYDLEKYILKKLGSIFYTHKARALHILVNIGCTEKSYSFLQKFRTSKNKEIRLYAIENLITSGHFNIEKDFFYYKYPLSLWEQMNYYYLFINRLNKEPKFENLLYSPNPTIIIFGLRMMRLFNQTFTSVERHEQLFINKDVQTRVELYRLLASNRQVNITSQVIPNIDTYRFEDILTNYARLNYVTTEMMMDIYEHTDNIDIKKHILICIYDYIKNGKNDVEHFAMQSEDNLLAEMCKKLVTGRKNE